MRRYSHAVTNFVLPTAFATAHQNRIVMEQSDKARYSRNSSSRHKIKSLNSLCWKKCLQKINESVASLITKASANYSSEEDFHERTISRDGNFMSLRALTIKGFAGNYLADKIARQHNWKIIKISRFEFFGS